MSTAPDKHTHNDTAKALALLRIAVGVGVFWGAWGVHGFWWGLVYGLFWEEWVGYRLALFLLGA